MRIALLSWESLHSVAVGGVASHVTELAAALKRKGHEVHVFTRLAHGQRCNDRVDGVHYHRCPYAGHPDFVDDINNMCRAFVDSVFAVEDRIGAFDVVHAHDWLAANAMIWIKQGRGRKTVLTIHATEYARCGNAFPNGRSHRIRTQERAGTYWADRLITVSNATRGEVMWMYEVPDWKPTVVYNGVSPHRFDAPVDPGEVKKQYAIGPLDPMVLFCGRLEWQKGPDLLVEAIPAVLRAHPAAKFVFVGDGGMRGQLEARVRQLGVAHAVRFLGFRNGDELVRLFKACQAVCVPSRNEPFGIVVLEAWAARKPVVVTQNGGPNEYVSHEENGLKIYPQPNSIVWGLVRLFSDFEHARWMGENGRRAVEARFTWDMIADQTLAAYGVPPAEVAVVRQAAARTRGAPERKVEAQPRRARPARRRWARRRRTTTGGALADASAASRQLLLTRSPPPAGTRRRLQRPGGRPAQSAGAARPLLAGMATGVPP
jgi:glycosyltransferase involved in cell wall biosynthesis